MSSRAARVTIFLLVVAVLLAVAYVVVPRVGMGHRHIDTIGKIAFLSDGDRLQKPHVWIINQDSTGVKDLTPGSQSCADPSFSPDGSQISYVSDKQGQQEVYVMDADGLHAHAVTFGSAAKLLPQFAPDGKSLGYIAQGTLTSIDLQSSDTTPLLPSPNAATSADAATAVDVSHAAVLSYAWSQPMGSGSQPEIAAVQEEVGVPGVPDEEVLTLLPSESSTPIELAAAQDISFCWSADGSRIYAALLGARVGPQQNTFTGIITFTADGKLAQNPPFAQSNSAAIGPTQPEVSPDGKYILFSVVDNPDLAHNVTLGLFVQSLDGSSQPHELIRGPAKGAEWSPDGTRLLVLLPRHGSPGDDLWIASLNGTLAPTNLTLGSGDVSTADWSPSLPKSN